MMVSAAGSAELIDVDVVVVGAGLLGSAVAARLSQTTARVAFVEAAGDVCEGASKGNGGNTISFYGEPGSEETALLNLSNPRWEELTERLGVPFRRIGSVVVACTDEEEERMVAVHDQVLACGARAEFLTAAQVHAREPLVTPRCRAGLFLPDEGIIDPGRLTVAYASIAAENGAPVSLREPVIGVEREAGRLTILTPHLRLRTRFMVNCAGLGSSRVSSLAGGETFSNWPRRGQYVLLDRDFGSRMSVIVCSPATPTTKGINVMPTTHGSVLVGPTARDDVGGDDSRATDRETLEFVRSAAARLVPATAGAYAIKRFASNRPASEEPHRMRFDARVPELLHIQSRSAGLSLSPAAAEHALGLLRSAGLDVADRADAVRSLPRVPQLRTAPNPEELTAIDPGYGQVVCVCEQVSAAEIAAALSSPCPATSIEGVRKRTGAAFGRCQGSLCMAGIGFMTAIQTGCGPRDLLQTSSGTVGS
jgi:glycerol-3-phosphate dehydrogenase